MSVNSDASAVNSDATMAPVLPPSWAGHAFRSLATLVAVLGAVLGAAACSGLVADRETARGDARDFALRVVDHGWHTAIVLRRRDVDEMLWPEVNDVHEALFVEVGWGDRDFYMAPRATGWLAVKAAFFTSGSVLHVAGFAAPIDTYFPRSDVVELRVSRRGLDALTRFVHDEYQRDEHGRIRPLAPGLYGESWFYAARSRYQLFNTCNTWVARALRSAGLDVTPAGTVTAGGLMQEARRAAAAR